MCLCVCVCVLIQIDIQCANAAVMKRARSFEPQQRRFPRIHASHICIRRIDVAGFKEPNYSGRRQ